MNLYSTELHVYGIPCISYVHVVDYKKISQMHMESTAAFT